MHLDKTFKNPPNEYRGKPFWSWNGRLEKDELIRQIDVMEKMGMGGYFMHSRTGLDTEYLGKEWFDLINACSDEGETRGMESWLYDEDRWPSGSAGGLVTADPRYRMRSLHLAILKPGSDISMYDDSLVALFKGVREGMNLLSYEPVGREKLGIVSGKDEILLFYVKEMDKSPFYNGYTYLDTLSRDATDAFIESTHEKYRTRTGDRLGKAITGMFTDEPHRGRLMSSFGSSESEASDSLNYSVPWTDKLPERYQEIGGFDLLGRLPELFFRFQGESVSQVKWYFVETIQQMFLDNFAAPIDKWCRRNDLILTGHVLHEDSLTAQTVCSGSVMRYYEHMEYPGIDILTEGNRCYWVVKQLSSVARQLGQKKLLSELYGCTGWQFDFEGHKNVGDWQALFGINLRCPHLSWYTMKGQAKRDYPASILHQSTWWEEYSHVEDYFSRIHVIMERGKPLCTTLVLNPVESVWSMVYPGWCDGLVAADPKVKELEERYADLFNWLAGGQIDFDYADEEMLSRLARVESYESGVLLRVGEATYRQVVVSGMATIRSSSLALLNEFIAVGGRVIFAGDPPAYMDALSSRKAQETAVRAVKIPFDREDLLSALVPYGNLPVKLTMGQSGSCEHLFVQGREEEGRRFIMILNTDRENGIKDIQLDFSDSDKAHLYRWDCVTGLREPVDNTKRIGEEGRIAMVRDFLPGESVIYEWNREERVSGNDHPVEKETKQRGETFSADSSFSYDLDEPNVCVLDYPRWRLDRGEWQAPCEVLKADNLIRDRLNLPQRAGNMLQPWFLGKKENPVLGQVELAFDFSAEVIPQDHLSLVIESPEEFSVFLNDNPVPLKGKDRWIDIGLKKFPLDPSFLVKGRNRIILKTDYTELSGLEAIYLLGNFAVELTGHTGEGTSLTALPETLKAGDICTQGLPFYSGRILYKMKGVNPGKGRLYVKLKEFQGACAKAGGTFLGWHPYEADVTDEFLKTGEIKLEIVLTRRNTFGPLHQKPVLARAYGPGNFTTRGEYFSEDYKLLESGLLEPPLFEVR